MIIGTEREDGRRLYGAVCAFPQEDTPRLAYADWLDETAGGESAERYRGFAEFIRLSVRVARDEGFRGVTYRPFAPLAGLFKKLELGSLPFREFSPREFDFRDFGLKELSFRDWRRGFPGAVTAVPAYWLRYGDPLRKAIPVEEVRLTGTMTWRRAAGAWQAEVVARVSGKKLEPRPDGVSLSAGGHSRECLRARWVREFDGIAVGMSYRAAGITSFDSHGFGETVLGRLLAAEWPGIVFSREGGGNLYGAVGELDFNWWHNAAEPVPDPAFQQSSATFMPRFDSWESWNLPGT